MRGLIPFKYFLLSGLYEISTNWLHFSTRFSKTDGSGKRFRSVWNILYWRRGIDNCDWEIYNYFELTGFLEVRQGNEFSYNEPLSIISIDVENRVLLFAAVDSIL